MSSIQAALIPATLDRPSAEARIRGLVAEYKDSAGASGGYQLFLGPDTMLMRALAPVPAQPVGIFLSARKSTQLETPERFTTLERKGEATRIVEMLNFMEPV